MCITSFASGVLQAEPSVFVDSIQPDRILVAANTWSAPNYTAVRVSPCVSDDGGASWDCQTAAILPLAYGDPASVITKNGRHYGMFIHDYLAGGGDQGVAVSTSGGAPGTWAAAEFPGFAPTGAFLDRGHLCVDNSLATPELYAAWSVECCPAEGELLVQFRHATEASILNWNPAAGPIPISDVAGRGSGTLDWGVNLEPGPSNRVFACWGNGNTPFASTSLGFARSSDKGTSWPLKKYIDQVIDGGVSKSLHVSAPGFLDGANSPKPGITPCMALHKAAGELCLVWTNLRNPVETSGTEDPDIWFIKSPDFGDTWYGPVRVNQVTTGAQWYPWITVDDATGAIVVLYYDSRDHSPFAAEAYASVSSDGGTSWTDIRISDGGPGDPPAASYSAFISGGGNDYLGIMARDGLAFPVWTDDRDRTPADICPAPLLSGCSGSAPPWKLYTSPILLGGIQASTIYPIIGQSCSGVGDPRVRFEVDWSSAIDMDGLDKLTVIPPGRAPITVSTASTSSSHQLVHYDIPCVTGNWAYVVESSKGLGISRSDTLNTWVACMSCPPACHPPCELE